MRLSSVNTFAFAAILACLCPSGLRQSSAETLQEVKSSQTFDVWPADHIPGKKVDLPQEADTSKAGEGLVAGQPIIRLGNVSVPTIEVFQPSDRDNTGDAVIICPGGGHHILAYDLEGTEVAKWCVTHGITGIVLKYRVPFRDPENKSLAALQDAQRAIRMVRSKSSEWKINPQRVGILGFSAGGEVAARASLQHSNASYEAFDETDRIDPQPSFTALIYPAYLVDKANLKLLPELLPNEKTSPMFLVHTWDDSVTPLSSIELASELKRAKVKCELHLYDRGGHGYGMRHVDALPVTDWGNNFAAWIKQR